MANGSDKKKRQDLVLVLTAMVLSSCTLLPEPVDPTQWTDLVAQDHQEIFAMQEPLQGNVSLYQAMARALRYNMEYRVSLLEKTLSQNQLALAQFDLLPKPALGSQVTSRSNWEASSGYSITHRSPSPAYSTSQDLTKATYELGVVWNFLDLGVSYVQAEQEADRMLINEERRRKAVHNLLRDVRSAFWRAVSAQRLEGVVEPILADARQAMSDARKVEAEELKPLAEILRYQRALQDVIRQLEGLRRQLAMARIELAALLGLPPDTPLVLEVPDKDAFLIPKVKDDLDTLETMALDQRPELREAFYQTRISAADTRKALLRMLPGLEFNVSHQYDSNSYTLNNQWETAGLRVSWNLFNLFTSQAARRLADNQEELARQRRLAQHMAVLTQVHLSFRQLNLAVDQLHDLEEIARLDQRLLQQVAAQVTSEGENLLERIRAATSAIMSRLQLYQGYAEVQTAFGRLMEAVGRDPLPIENLDSGLEPLAQALATHLTDWDAGEITLQPVDEVPLPTLTEEALARSVAQAVVDWASTWSSRRSEAFLAFYSSRYTAEAWSSRLRKSLQRAKFLEVRVDDLRVTRLDHDRWQVVFRQHYRSDRYQDQVEKTLIWVQEDKQWRIVAESSRKLPVVTEPVRPAPAPAVAPPPPPPEPPPPAPEPPPENWLVQVGYFLERADAERLLKTLASRGLAAQVHEIVEGRGRMAYTLHLGPFPSKGQAKLILWTLQVDMGIKSVLLNQERP